MEIEINQPSAIDKFNARKKKTKELNNGGKPMPEETKKIDWNEELKNSELYKIAENKGLSLDFFKAENEESYKRTLDLLHTQLKERNDLSSDEKSVLETQTSGIEPEAAEKQNTDKSLENNEQPKAEEENKTFEVGTLQEPGNDLQWIEEKRKFWSEFAQEVKNTFENDSQKDLEEKSFSCALSIGDLRGEIKYTAPNAAQISKDSHLTMYQGLVKDALQNNLSITFGQSLDDKQKAMLLAACLMNKNQEVQMVNPPKIDINADYFKQLPEDVRATLTDYAQKLQLQEKQAEIDSKMADIKKKLQNRKDKPISSEENTALRTEQLNILREQAVHDPSKQAGYNQEVVEKVMAARMGIINNPEIKNAKGQPIVKDEEYAKRKSEQNPGLQAYLINKYAKQEGK